MYGLVLIRLILRYGKMLSNIVVHIFLSLYKSIVESIIYDIFLVGPTP